MLQSTKKGNDFQFLQFRNHRSLEGRLSPFKHENNIHSNQELSRIEKKDFICTGNCFCDDDNEGEGREAISTAISTLKGITVFISALTTSFAFNEARKYLKVECDKKLSDSCSIQSVRSFIDKCELNNEDYGSFFGENIEDRKYHCSGYCMTKKFIAEKTRKLAREFDCSKLKVEGEIELKVEGIEPHHYNQFARMKFQKDRIKSFCKDNSAIEYGYKFMLRGKQICERKKIIVCVSQNMGKINPSLKCRQTYPVI